MPRTVDRAALGLYLQYQYVPSPLTILQGVQKLPPASVLSWDGGEPTVETYWVPAYEPKSTQTFEEDVDEGMALVERGRPAAAPERRAGGGVPAAAGWTRASSPR